MRSARPGLVLFITEDWFFCSHFIERAMAAAAAGYRVTVVTRVSRHAKDITDAGLHLIPLDMSRRGLNPLREIGTLYSVWKIYRKEKPDIVHHIALKPILYGTLAAKLVGVRAVINAPVGMGFVFTSGKWLARMLRPAVQIGLRWLLNPLGSRVVFENCDDLEALAARQVVRRDAAVLIRGAGVNLEKFRHRAEPEGTPMVVLVARMLWDKGIGEFIEAARILKSRGVAARLVLVGAPDEGNPSSIPGAVLESWVAQGLVEWWGQRQDVAEILSNSHLVCLPSYREGLPKSLLEAAAAGRAIVTTDVPGCREVVRQGESGLLVPVRNARALADALERLCGDGALRRRMGERGRQIAVAEFSTERIVDETMRLYRSLAPP